ncbi:MAG: PPC domain-containing DNA-binding protein [Cyanobacteria bacterium P01_G01_bin.54]
MNDSAHLLTPARLIAQFSQNPGLQPIALRLEPGDDVRQTLEAIAKQKNIQAGFVLSAVGSLSTVSLRFADAETATELPGKHEVLSLSGTLSTAGAHLHLLVANTAGECRGGHLVAGCTVYTTLELVIGQLTAVRFERVMDRRTGFPELAIVPVGVAPPCLPQSRPPTDNPPSHNTPGQPQGNCPYRDF